MSRVPEIRIRTLNPAAVNPGGDFVLYWMVAFRRVRWNFGLQRAAEWARDLQRPLVILEALRCDYPWASSRLHRFILDGMADNQSACAGMPVLYYPFVEAEQGQGKGLIETLGHDACVAVTDDTPCFFLPRMLEAASRKVRVRLEAVDSNGLLPLRAADREFTTAFSFRKTLQKALPAHLPLPPKRNPVPRGGLPRLASLPRGILERWPPASPEILGGDPDSLRRLPIDHSVPPVETRGGSEAAADTLDQFLRGRLGRYAEERNHPDLDATSGLSPYLHFGHLSVHEILDRLAGEEDWSPSRVSSRTAGARAGWWGMSENAEAFLDQLVTWRELGFHLCARREDYQEFDSLPGWARETLGRHARDPRPYVYTREEFETAATHDPLWNAAQNQLLTEGRIHNYLRMLWGKKILHWSASPEEALEVMIALNDRHALDGRDPNSYSGIFWVMGRYDRPWGPERPVFGKVRYMSSENTARKLQLEDYLGRYGG